MIKLKELPPKISICVKNSGNPGEKKIHAISLVYRLIIFAHKYIYICIFVYMLAIVSNNSFKNLQK